MTGSTRHLNVLITLRGNLLMRVPSDPSRRVTLDHIPGTAIQGMLANALAGTPELIDAAVRGRSIHIAPAYPTRQTSSGWLPALPTPRSWIMMRVDGTDAPRDLLLDPTIEGTVTSLPPYLAQAGDGRLVSLTPDTGLRDRNTGDRDSRTVGPNGGTPYQDVLLLAGQSFLSTWLLHGDTAAALDALHELLEQRLVQPAADGRLVLGGGGTGAGGHITITLDPPLVDHTFAPTTCAPVPVGGEFTVLARTPIHVIDPGTGAARPDALPEALVAHWGIDAVAVAAAHLGRSTVGGYNSHYRHDLPPAWCAAAGSVVRLTARRDLSAGELAGWLAQPFGGRSAQGCGHLAILDEEFAAQLPSPSPLDDPTLDTGLDVAGLRLGDGDLVPVPVTGLSNAYLDLLLTRPLQETIPVVAKELARELVGEAGVGPSRHLWAVLERELSRPIRPLPPDGVSDTTPAEDLAPTAADLLHALDYPGDARWQLPIRTAEKLGERPVGTLRTWTTQPTQTEHLAKIAAQVTEIVLTDPAHHPELANQITEWVTRHRDQLLADLFGQVVRQARRHTAPNRAEATGGAQ